MEGAHALEMRGRVDLAAQKWQQVLLSDPNNTDALGGLARAAKSAGNPTLAAQYLERLRAINPNDPGIARAEQMGTEQDHAVQLQRAGKLAQQGQYAESMNIYRQIYGNDPPPGDTALAYYETEASTEEGRPHAVAGLRSLVAKFPGDSRYQIALGTILTYNPRTRPEGRHILEQHPNDPQAVEALRKSLLWDAQNPGIAPEIKRYVNEHPDPTLENILRNEPKTARATPVTPEQLAAQAANASRTAEERAAYADLNAKRLPEAEAKFKAILANTPDNPQALAGMGYLRMQQGNFGGAISFLIQAKQDGSKDPGVETALNTSRFWYTMGEAGVALNDNDLPTAEKEYRAALQMRPDNIQALEGLGGTLLKANQPDAAIPYFSQFVRLAPNASHAWRGLFLAQYGTGNAQTALATERQMPPVVRLELAKDPLYLRQLASALTSVGREADAQRVLSGAMNLPFSPTNPTVELDTKLQYAALLLEAKHYDQAEGLYRDVETKAPSSIGAFQGLVRSQHAAGQDQLALQTIEATAPEIYSKAMQDGGFDVTVAFIYQSQGRVDVAQDILEKTLQNEIATTGKPVVDVQIQLAGIYLQRNNPQLAFPLYQKAISQHPDRLDAWRGLIDSLHTTGHDQEALAQLQQMPPAIRTQLESNVDYLQTVGAIYASLNQPQQAQIFLRRVEAYYVGQHLAPPAEVEIQNAWLMYNAQADDQLWHQLMLLGTRNDLTITQRHTVQTIWTNFSVRRANAAAAAGNDRQAIDILNATAHAFPGNPVVIKALAGGYARVGMTKQAVAIWKSMDMRSADADDYRSAIGSALAADDQKDAETWLRFGLNKYPKNPQILLLGAKFEESRGDTNRARDYYRSAFKNMPKDDPGAAMVTELSRPANPNADLPGSPRSAQDLSTLLAPGTQPVSRVRPQEPTVPADNLYLPGGASGNLAPVQLGYPDASQPNLPAAQPSNTQPSRLKDYVPHASLSGSNGSGLGEAPISSSLIEQAQSQEVLPVLTPASFHPTHDPRLTQQPNSARLVLTAQPTGLPSRWAESANLPDSNSELAERATYRAAAYVSFPQQVQEPQVQQPTQQNPQTQQNTTKPATTPTTDNVVYGPYVPYVPPARRQATTPAPQQQREPQIPQPTAPLTAQPTGQPTKSSDGNVVVNGVVYGPYVPYVPPPNIPAATPNIQLGARPAEHQIPQPELTDVLPTAKVGPNSVSKVPSATHPDVAAQQAAANRRHTAAARAAANTGVSKPPVEDYSVSTESAPYTNPVPATQPVNQPRTTPAALYTKPAVDTTLPAQTSTGDSEGQQYPQPHTRGSDTTRSTRRTRPVATTTTAAETPVTPTPTPSSPALSYPGVGTSLGYQPYPVIGPAYPLPPAPTDLDLMQKQVPPLRGSYTGEELLQPNVPLTERQRAERDLAALESSYSGWIGGTGSIRYRSGVVGYDRLADLETTFEASFVANNSVRFSVVPKAVFLNSGQLNVGNYTGVTGSPVIGTFNTAIAVNNPTEQFANGIGGELQMTSRTLALAVGYTPYEFLVENFTGRALWRPNSHFTLYVNRDPVQETQLSYAGLRDPGSATSVYPGNIWGGVVATGGGVRFDLGDEKAGFYMTGDGADLTGYHVLENKKFEGSMGAYFLAHTFPGYGRLNIGGSLFGMHYSQNERPLSYGLGGYFSPDAYFLASIPVTFVGRYKSNFHYSIAGSVGIQTFQEDSQVYFPLDRGIQTGFATSQNCTTATIANHTCGQYPVNSNTGGNYNINTEGAYRIGDHWYAGGFLSGNNTNNYNTVTAGFFVRYLFRPQVGTDGYPTGLFPVEGFRPLRVP